MEKILKNTFIDEKDDELHCINCYSNDIYEEDKRVNCCITYTRDVNTDDITDDSVDDSGESDSIYYYCNSCNTEISPDDISIFNDHLQLKGVR